MTAVDVYKRQRYSYSSASYYNTLSAVTFTPSATSTGVATFSFTAYDTNGNAYNGTLRITVEKGSTCLLYTSRCV